MGNTSSESQLTCHTGSNKTLTVDYLQNENAKNPVDVVLCFVDTKWSSDDQLNQAVSSLAGNIYVTERERLKAQYPVCSPGNVFCCKGGKLNCKAILQVVVPDGDLSQHLLLVPSILQNAIQKASELGARSIAIPLGIEPPFQVNILLPSLYMTYLNHDRASSLTQFHIITTNSALQSQILQSIEEMNENISTGNSDDDEPQTVAENSAADHDKHSQSLYNNEVLTQGQQVHPLPRKQASDMFHDTVHENFSDQTLTNNTAETPGEVSDQHFQEKSEDPEHSGTSVQSSYMFPVEQLHKHVEKISNNDFLKSVNFRTSDDLNTRVTFSDEVEECIDPKQPPLVRSLSSGSDDLSSLDFQNFCVKRPVTRFQGKRPVQRGEPVVVVKYDEEESAKKADPVFFCVVCQSEHKVDCQKKLDKCGHIFCSECIDDYFSREKPVCPICNTVYGEVKGNMPPGIMSYFTSKGHLPGHEDVEAIVIEYDIPDGVQTEEHPNPGKSFKGACRTAYLPNTEQGQKCLRLLQRAFDQKLTFTVGRSRTTGNENCVTWNDIHHKTNVQGGPQRFGYPDPSYLDRLEKELQDRGITED
ncbi:uncharacterized protein LOC133189938 [Saccostrea echinata]|uniref:uncharacterized protein LOC133189938 n=1 Tax=Saccostrea echinata TaxID=191078 RepID=UPI002A7F566A|nr:uncharacterized protein LOC133189938 [Saccostrea echinata]